MTIKHITDQIENYGLEVARKAYLKGLQESYDPKLKDKSIDDINDELEQIVKEQLI